MRTRRQTELSEVVRVRQAGQKSSEREKKKKTESGGLFGGAKGKCNLIKHGWRSRQRA